ncbi:MAG: HEAT repeat domain-containing protein [Planctomycetes bacterium]|nr:HEAT repeat domain-containing protein [Planctomycetota bacterium]
MFAASMLVLFALIGSKHTPQKGPTLPWKNSKELARLKDDSTPLAERKTLAHELGVRAQERDECLDLAHEFLALAVQRDTEDELADELMLAVRGCPAVNVRAYLLRELAQSTNVDKIERILQAAVTWKDPKLDEYAAQEYLKEPRGGMGGWWRWFLASDGYGALVPRIVERVDDPKVKDEELLLELLGMGKSLISGTGQYSTWKFAMRRYAVDPRDVVRRFALQYLCEHVEDGDLQACIAAAQHSDWSTRRAAIDALAKLRSAPAVDGILETMAREETDSRLRAGCARALFRLTRQRFGRDVEAWTRWWSGAGKKLPPAPAENAPAKAAPAKAQPGKDEPAKDGPAIDPPGKDAPVKDGPPNDPPGKDVSPKDEPAKDVAAKAPVPIDDSVVDPELLGTEVSSNRILVVLDVDDLCVTAKSDPLLGQRLTQVRAAIEAYVRQLSDTSAWNVIIAREKPVAWKPSLTVALAPNRRDARAASAAKKGAGANAREHELELFRAFLDEQLEKDLPAKRVEKKTLRSTLEAAWAQSEADTILLISDGHALVPKLADASKKDPNEGALSYTAKELDQNRHVRVHTFALGEDVPRLKKLAQELWGEYRRVP